MILKMEIIVSIANIVIMSIITILMIIYIFVIKAIIAIITIIVLIRMIHWQDGWNRLVLGLYTSSTTGNRFCTSFQYRVSWENCQLYGICTRR